MSVPVEVREFIGRALREDIGHGDITTEAVIPASASVEAVVVAKEEAVVAGLGFAAEVFRQSDPALRFTAVARDAARVRKGTVLCRVRGGARGILAAERVALNILQRLSGIATATARLVSLVKGYNVRIVDTRKTTPCMRFMEKYAVRMGGGHNHRFGLFDGILIKDNHIRAAGGIGKAVKKARACHHLFRVEVEVGSLKEFREALRAGADVIMLDNMSVDAMKRAVEEARSRDGASPLLEASGNVSEENIRQVAATGVDLISVGAITHSAPSVDMSLRID